MPGIALKLSGGLAGDGLSADDGSYSFPSAAVGLDYGVSLAKADDDSPANGVSTLDIALIRRHILGSGLLDSPYKLLAADVNGSGTITTVDIALIRRLVLGFTNTLPMGLWRFVPADYVFPDPANPWKAPAQRWYTNLLANAEGQDYVAIELGDVDNSWGDPGVSPMVGSGGGSAPWASAKLRTSPLRFAASRQVVQPAKRVAVAASLSGFGHATSVQFTLGWDAKVLRHAGVGEFGLRGLGGGNFGTALVESGRLTFSWDDPEGTGVEAADGTDNVRSVF